MFLHVLNIIKPVIEGSTSSAGLSNFLADRPGEKKKPSLHPPPPPPVMRCGVNARFQRCLMSSRLCRNVIHGSDSVESARKEIALWFPDGPVNWQSSLHPWIYE